MLKARRFLAFLATAALLGAAPRHVLTSDYWGGYSGTHNLPAERAAQWLSFAMVEPPDANLMSGLGVKTILYTNPNREQPRDPMWTNDENEYAHTCSGDPVRGETAHAGQLMTNPGSPAMQKIWRWSVKRHTVDSNNAHYDFVFADEAGGAAAAQDQPCNFTFDGWLRDENALFASLGRPVIYNGLVDYYNHGVAREIALNQTAAGGELEECYAQLHPDHRVGGWEWYTIEATELQMAQQHKYFICYGRDLTPADQAYDGRLYTYASFLLTYDPNTTILWEYYKTPSGGHVMPESQIVALHPQKPVSRVAELREPGGAYVRRYRDCYIDGRRVGACAAAVNPDDDPRTVNLSAYHRSVRLNGSGIFDGGSVSLVRTAPMSTLPPRTGIVVFE